MALYLLLIFLGSVALVYMLRFTEATLAIGRSLRNVKTGRELQGAITPPKIGQLAFPFQLFASLESFMFFGNLNG